MRFTVRTFSLTVDSWNENRHLDAACYADGMRCSVPRPLVTERMQMLHAPLSTRKSGNDASGLLPRLCGGKHTQTRMHNRSHQLIFVQQPLFIIFCFCLYSGWNRNESGGNAAYLRVYSRFASRLSGRGDFIHSKSNLPEQEMDRHWPEFG